MKNIEYFYNVIYYFFYRGTIKFAKGSIYLGMPIVIIFYFFINRIPSIRKYYVTEENDNPLDVAIKRTKKSIENPKNGLAKMLGGGISISVVMTLYIGIYNIIRNLIFPTFEDSFAYVLMITATLAFITDVFLSQIYNKDEKYIKEFNKRKGWWRVKWSIITALTPFIVIWFAIATAR